MSLTLPLADPPRTFVPIDLQVGRFVTRPGPVVLEPSAEHRIKVHSGTPVTGTCARSRFRYSHGDVDLLPAGSADTWEEDQASASVMLRFAPALLSRTAEELGLDGARVGLNPQHQLHDAQIAHLAWALDAEQRGRPARRPPLRR